MKHEHLSRQHDLLTDVEAASRVKLAAGTLRNLRHQGRGPRFVRLGRAVRYRTEDLDEWIAANLVFVT